MKVFLKKKKKKSNNMVVNDTKIYQMIKNKSLLSMRKAPHYNYKKLFLFFKKSNDLEKSFDEEQIKDEY